MKKSLHIFIQKNHGIGKTVACMSFIQACMQEGKNVKCFDADQQFATLRQYEFPETKEIDMNPTSLDVMFNELVAEDEAIYVVDTNSADYSKTNSQLSKGVLEKLQKQGVSVYIHSVVIGGNKLVGSLQDLSDLIGTYTSSEFVIWTNQYFGDVTMAGKDFTGMKVYENNENVIKAVVNIEKPASYMEKDIKDMIKQHIPYGQIKELDMPESTANRMCRFYDHIFAQVKKEIFGGRKFK
jgi:hypothetical protein